MPLLIDYIRHGEPIGGNRYRGNAIDDPLSEKGWAQMKHSTQGTAPWSRIISSPLTRCQAFAHWLGEQHQLPVHIEDDLREVGFGSWEGETKQTLLANRAEEFHAFYDDPVNQRPEGAEPLDHFGQRCANVFDQLCKSYSDEHLLVVAHAGVIRATFGYVTQAPASSWYRADVTNASITRFAVTDKLRKLIHFNCLPHGPLP